MTSLLITMWVVFALFTAGLGFGNRYDPDEPRKLSEYAGIVIASLLLWPFIIGFVIGVDK